MLMGSFAALINIGPITIIDLIVAATVGTAYNVVTLACSQYVEWKNQSMQIKDDEVNVQ